jgi:regulatory protein
LTDSAAKAKKYAFRLLGYRSRSEKELEDRLQQKGFSGDEISFALKQLKEAGYIDDYALAMDLKRQAYDHKLFGYARTKKLLIDRGVPVQIVNAALMYDEEAETGKIRKLIGKKLRTLENYPADRRKKKLWDFLVRKGYSFSTINEVFRDLTEFEFEEEK